MKRNSQKMLFVAVVLLVLICALVVVPLSASRPKVNDNTTENTAEETILLNSVHAVYDVTVAAKQNQIGYADQDVLVITTLDGREIQRMSYGVPSYELIAYDRAAQKWWGFDSLTNSFHIFSDEGEFIAKLEPKISDVSTTDLFKVHNDQYLLLSGGSQQHSGKIWVYDLKAETGYQYEPNGMVTSIQLLDDNMLVAMISGTTGMYLEWYNIETQKTERQMTLNTNLAASIGVSPNEELYYIASRSVYRISGNDQEIVGYLPGSANTTYSEKGLRIFPSVNGCYVWTNGQNCLSYISFIEEEHAGGLVVDASFYVPAAMKIYQRDGSKVDFRDRGIVSAEQYLTLMLSKDSSVDVYMLRSYVGSEARSIIAKGFYEDLAQSEIISFDTQTWFDRLYQDSSYDGKMFGYPYGVSFQMLLCNQKELDRIGLELPPKQLTWNELLDLLEPYSGQKPFPLIVNPTQLTQLILWQAYNAPSDKFAVAAEEALSILQRCNDMGMYDLPAAEYMRAYQFGENYALKIELNTLGSNNETPFVPVPMLENSSCGTPIWYDWLLINPFSSHKQEAFRYIEAHSQAHAEGDMQWSAVLSPNIELYPRFSEEWMSRYQYIMDHSSAYLVYALEDDFIEICNKFLQGQITQADALAQMLEKYTIAANE